MNFPLLAEIVLLGTPGTAGSKTGYAVRRKTAGGWEYTGQVAIADAARKKSRPWRTGLKEAAREAMAGRPVFTGPVAVQFIFTVNRPKGHYGTGRNEGTVKDSAPRYPGVKPDGLKYQRLAEDVLTGTVWKDDAQIVCWTGWKVYPEGHKDALPEPGVVIRAYRLPGTMGA